MTEWNWTSPFKWDKAKREASLELIRRTGSMSHILSPTQKQFYDMLKTGIREAALYCSRKQGKSYFNLLYAYEFCWNNPGVIVRLVAPELKQARDIYFPLYNEMKPLIPSEMSPEMKKADAKFVFPNGSQIALGGAKPENIESSRGPIAHLLLLDEIAAFVDGADFRYALYSILYPQLTTTGGAIIHTTTPPRSCAHVWFVENYTKLKDKGHVLEFDIDSNPLLTQDMIRDIEETYGGRSNPDFRREHLLELISEQSLLVCPEFNDETHLVDGEELVKEWLDRNDSLFPFIVTDYGATDDTGTVCVLYNYSEQVCLAIEESTVKNGNIKEFVESYWKHHTSVINQVQVGNEPHSIIDCMEQTRKILKDVYNMEFKRPKKRRHKADSVTYLRDKVASGQVLVSKSCPRLRSMLKLGMWKDTKGDLKEFERTETLSHLDHLDALIYAVLYIPWGKLPGASDTHQNMRLR